MTSFLGPGGRQEIGAILVKRTLFKMEDAVRPRKGLAVVRCDEEGCIGFPDQVVQKRQHLLAGLVIEVSRRLICENEEWIVSKAPRHGDALLLTAGESVGKAVEAIGEADVLQDRFRPARGLGRWGPRELKRQEDILHDGERGDEVERLEDESNVRAPEERPVRLREGREVRSINYHPAGGREVDAADEVEKRALARAAPAHQYDGVASVEGQRYTIQDRALGGALRVGLRHVVQVQEGIGAIVRHRNRSVGEETGCCTRLGWGRFIPIRSTMRFV